MRPLDVLVDAALGTYEEDCRWELIGGILRECSDDVLELGIVLLQSRLERERTLGADILGRLVGVEPLSHGAVLTAMLQALSAEKASGPLASMVAAIGHIGDPETLGLVFPLAADPSAAVRLAVAFAEATVSPQPLAPEARAALIRLSATSTPRFATGPRSALGRCPTPTARMSGPPCWRGPRMLTMKPGRRHCSAWPSGPSPRGAAPDKGAAVAARRRVEVDAAAVAADPRLLPALWALQQSGTADEVRLRHAIDRCSGRDRQALLS